MLVSLGSMDFNSQNFLASMKLARLRNAPLSNWFAFIKFMETTENRNLLKKLMLLKTDSWKCYRYSICKRLAPFSFLAAPATVLFLLTSSSAWLVHLLCSPSAGITPPLLHIKWKEYLCSHSRFNFFVFWIPVMPLPLYQRQLFV